MKQPTKILHLTDLHLFGNQKTKLLGVNPLESLNKVIDKILHEPKHNHPDLIVLTGDISQDYSLESYKMAAKIMQQLPGQVVSTMGNHDHRLSFTKIFGSPTQIITELANITNWRIIVLNSHLPEHVGGHLNKTELGFLQEKLNEDTTQPVLIFLHHHILSVESTWLDKIGINNSSQFLEIIDKYKNVKAVVCGHEYQETAKVRGDVIYLSTPSSCWQFALKSPGFKLDTLMPGYRWLELDEDGSIKTGVARIDHDDGLVPDVNSTGY